MDNITAINMLKMRNMGVCLPDEVYETAIEALEENRKYHSIGTIEECREAVEKQRAKKIIHNPEGGVDEDWLCPSCGKFSSPYHKFCINCGQRIERDTE